MDKEIEDKLAENAASLLDFVEKSSSFVVEQAPIYVQELIQFHFFESVVGLVSNIIILTVILIASICAWKSSGKVDADGDRIGIRSCLTVAAVFFLSVGFSSSVSYSKEMYKAKYAPRVLIIEKLRGQ